MLELATVTVASLVAGFVNAIAGGGGLISIPVLFSVFPAAPPATLFGTSKAAMVWGTAWAAADYSRHVRLPWQTLLPACLAAAIGGFAGAWLVTLVSADWLRSLLPVMLTLALVWQFMIPMAVANVVGSHFGARLALSRGSGFIRVVFIAVVAALILKSVIPVS